VPTPCASILSDALVLRTTASRRPHPDLTKVRFSAIVARLPKTEREGSSRSTPSDAVAFAPSQNKAAAAARVSRDQGEQNCRAHRA
jgi:hypothetical protein